MSGRWRKRSAWAAFLLVGAIARPSLEAPAPDPEVLIRQGVNLRRQGDDEKAEVYFRDAYEIAPTPRSAAQLGLVELALSRFPEAEAYLSEALRSDDVWIRDYRATLEGSRAEARRHLAKIEIADVPTDATLTLEGATPRKLPPDGVIWVSPGLVRLRLESTGRAPITYSRNLAAGDADKIAMLAPAAPPSSALEASPNPTEPTAPLGTTASPDEGVDPGRPFRLAGIVAASAGVAALAMGLILYEVASSKVNAIDAEAGARGVYDEGKGNWQTFDHAGVGLLIGGGVAVAGGAALCLWSRAAPSHADESHVSVMITPGSQRVTFTAAF